MTAPVELAPATPDGRRLRRAQNREAVLVALAQLHREGNYTPSAAEIAGRAGLSPRSLFRYFDDVDDLHHAAIDAQLAVATALLAVTAAADAALTERVEALVEARLRMYDAIAPAARAARVCAHRHPVIAEQLQATRTYLRRQLERLFAAELGALPAAERPGVVACADVLCAFESYELMRGQRLSRARIAAAWSAALTRLLTPPTDERPAR